MPMPWRSRLPARHGARERQFTLNFLREEQEHSETYARQRTAAQRRLEEITAELVKELRSREQLQGETES